MSFFQVFNDNLELVSLPKSVNKEFRRQKITLRDLETFLRHLKIIIPYFCEHPLTILESIEELKENGLQSVLLALHKKNSRQSSGMEWNNW